MFDQCQTGKLSAYNHEEISNTYPFGKQSRRWMTAWVNNMTTMNYTT